MEHTQTRILILKVSCLDRCQWISIPLDTDSEDGDGDDDEKEDSNEDLNEEYEYGDQMEEVEELVYEDVIERGSR